ncbi:hypothetical protein [Novosphingobium sp. FSW06-99]|uniref:hypothetical protein n=1 Tax=Novosphingobium sp. FSW06-99 TaxID=1739113 RepID=UPI00076BE7C4|nr:hypothetical protein [Novosphingobium sp. FSW06-99]KUR74906.1 hypothetical protein AQZ49_16735 [Novosphingobium sp. FSW06-99]
MSAIPKKPREILALLVVLLSAQATRALARDFLPIGATPYVESWDFIETSSIAIDGTARTYWILSANTNAGADDPHQIAYIMRRYINDCQAHKTVLSYVGLYDYDGRLLKHDLARQATRHVRAHTREAAIEALACNAATPHSSPILPTIDDAIAWARAQKAR